MTLHLIKLCVGAESIESLSAWQTKRLKEMKAKGAKRELVVIGGGVSTAGEFLLRPARQVAQEFTMRGLGTKTEIRIARYGVHAGVRGAALLALTEEAAAG